MLNNESNYIIYGINRVQKDFEYIFNHLKIIGYISESEDIDIYNNKPVFSINKLSEIKYDKIIICSFMKDKLKQKLEGAGFIYNDNFIIADDIFSELDFPLIKKIKKRKLAIWGTGKSAQNFIENNKEFAIECYIDNNIENTNTYLNNIPVVHPNDIGNFNEYYIIVASVFYWEIRMQLQLYDLIEFEDFIWEKLIIPKASELLKQTIYDNSYYDFQCNTMHNVYEVEQTGMVSCCCTTFTDYRIGNLIYQDFFEIWNSNLHKILCLSLNNRTYTFCKKNMCQVLNLYKRKEISDCSKLKYIDFPAMPKSIQISIDETCNLYCESCRKCIVIDKENTKTQIMADKIIENLPKNLNFVTMAGNGEVFLSKIYERIWKSEKLNNVSKFKLLTNGTLFNEKKWKEFIKNKNSQIYLCVSIDAASKDTYKAIRRGGNFDILKENMKYASALRKKQELKYFQINFVVQRNNYKEMIDFVKWGVELGCDKVFFSRILNWGTYDDNEFERLSMVDSNGRPNIELEKILEDPIFDNPIVDVGTINCKQKLNNSIPEKLENFYDWEIQSWRNVKESTL